jgi:hypothetical protein
MWQVYAEPNIENTHVVRSSVEAEQMISSVLELSSDKSTAG